MSAYEFILVDSPREGVQRITLNRPEKRNPLFGDSETFECCTDLTRCPDSSVTPRCKVQEIFQKITMF